VAAAMGGNVRVGLEDSLWAGPGRMALVTVLHLGSPRPAPGPPPRAPR
jgi:hypothetical protein